MNLKALCLVTVLASSSLMFSATSMAQENSDLSGLQEHVVSDSVKYISGGVGDGEAEKLQSVQKEYNLRLTFVDKKGEYLSDIQVKIKNKKNKEALIDALSEGPFFYVRLPAGTYRVSAGQNGVEQKQTVTVGKNHTRALTYRFQNTDEN